MSWTAAQSQCDKQGGSMAALASVHSHDENVFVRNQLARYAVTSSEKGSGAWLGMVNERSKDG